MISIFFYLQRHISFSYDYIRPYSRDYLLAFITVGLILLSGCTTRSEDIYTKKLNNTHHQQVYVANDGLPITLWLSRQQKASNTIRLYIEGDGRAWLRRNRVSSDPTPKNRLVHSLMLQDSKIDKAYIARPCQYEKNNTCSPELWTFSRYSSASIQAINQAITFIKESKHYHSIELIGFSGGATIALLIAAQRNDIQSVRTIAGNLDPSYTNTLHRVSPMPTALNPKDFSNRLQHIPQWHFIGKSDPVILPVIFEHYLSAFKNKRCIKSQLIDHATHHNGWVNIWPKLLQLKLPCDQTP
ncbi:MAG: hypothetical protein PUP46_09575 [Endozoicomonas sp. (ex Botrylloides leachii)]|nr:hypothetical protein [Endozoicomonas sp. (ex Botrylloides leachii)]